jgi:hypothetical protein
LRSLVAASDYLFFFPDFFFGADVCTDLRWGGRLRRREELLVFGGQISQSTPIRFGDVEEGVVLAGVVLDDVAEHERDGQVRGRHLAYQASEELLIVRVQEGGARLRHRRLDKPRRATQLLERRGHALQRAFTDRAHAFPRRSASSRSRFMRAIQSLLALRVRSSPPSCPGRSRAASGSSSRSVISLFQCTWHLSRAMQTSKAWPYFSPTATTPSTECSHVFATARLVVAVVAMRLAVGKLERPRTEGALVLVARLRLDVMVERDRR